MLAFVQQAACRTRHKCDWDLLYCGPMPVLLWLANVSWSACNNVTRTSHRNFICGLSASGGGVVRLRFPDRRHGPCHHRVRWLRRRHPNVRLERFTRPARRTCRPCRAMRPLLRVHGSGDAARLHFSIRRQDRDGFRHRGRRPVGRTRARFPNASSEILT